MNEAVVRSLLRGGRVENYGTSEQPFLEVMLLHHSDVESFLSIHVRSKVWHIKLHTWNFFVFLIGYPFIENTSLLKNDSVFCKLVTIKLASWNECEGLCREHVVLRTFVAFLLWYVINFGDREIIIIIILMITIEIIMKQNKIY